MTEGNMTNQDTTETRESQEGQLCMVCGYGKPYGIFNPRTGAVVCVDCRDKARRPVQGWVSVSERLPTTEGNYLVTCADGTKEQSMTNTDTATGESQNDAKPAVCTCGHDHIDYYGKHWGICPDCHCGFWKPEKEEEVNLDACPACGKRKPPTPPGPPDAPGQWYCLEHRHLQSPPRMFA